MNYTTHYRLQKDLTVDKYNVNVVNMNSDIIDSALHRLDLKDESQDNLLATKVALNTEISRATAKENDIEDSLTSEISRATSAENALDTALVAHSTSESSHSDMRLLISGLTSKLNALADSDDTTLDQLSEIVTYIKNNKDLIDGITTSKVNVSDIIDDLTSSATDKPLSSKQGMILNGLINDLVSIVENKVDKVSGKGLSTNDYTTEEKTKLSGISTGAEANIQSDWNITDSTSNAFIKNKPTIPTIPTSLPANGGNADTLDGYHSKAFQQQFHYSTKDQKTGYYKININSTATWMLQFDIKIYQNYNMTTLSISGYQYGNNYWYNPKARIIDSSLTQMNVIFGYDDINSLWIAIPAGSYTGLTICNINNAFTQVENWSNNFVVTHQTELTGTIQTTITAYSPWKRNEINVVSTSSNGLCPKIDGNTSKFLRGDGTWAVPIFDNANNIIYSDSEPTTLFEGMTWISE